MYDRITNGSLGKVSSKERIGVTQEPLLSEEILIVSPLHVMLRMFDFLIRLVVLLSAGIYEFTDNKNVLGPTRNRFFQTARQRLIDTQESGEGI